MRTLGKKLCGIPFAVLLAGFAFADTGPCPSCDRDAGRVSAGWLATGDLNVARSGHVATPLLDGRVLVLGGATPIDDSVELYDPNLASWSFTGRLATRRGGYTATRLPDGKVLVAGGFFVQGSPWNFTYTNTAALYDPATAQWSATGSMKANHAFHTATLLQDGKVLVSGGYGLQGASFFILGISEIYDPATGTWSQTGSLNEQRFSHTATLLQDGRVLVVGGSDESDFFYTLSQAELYDPVTGKWTTSGGYAVRLESPTATLLPSGKVLVAGGYTVLFSDATFNSGHPASLSKTRLFDPVSGTWSPGPDMNHGRFGHTATLLPNGDVLVTGGYNYSDSSQSPALNILNSAERYDAGSQTWTRVNDLITRRAGHSATLLPTGDVLIAGGNGRTASVNEATPLKSAELFRFDLGPAAAMVVEFYNADLDHYFITADPGEQAFVDTGAVGRWARTGGAFKSGGPAQVCRFGGNPHWNPTTQRAYGPNSHFYTADPAECAGLIAGYRTNRPAWRFEGYDFTTTLPGQGGCAANLKPVYRAYNNGIVHGVDSNHRITSDPAHYQASVAAGWIGEGVVMCAPH